MCKDNFIMNQRGYLYEDGKFEPSCLGDFVMVRAEYLEKLEDRIAELERVIDHVTAKLWGTGD